MAKTDNATTTTGVLKTELNAVGRHYVVNDAVLDSHNKWFAYKEHDLKLLKFAQGHMGTLSDTFILYAVAMLGACDRSSIKNFLLALWHKNPSLNIADPSDLNALKLRLIALVDNGFLFRNGYKYDNYNPVTNTTSVEDGIIYCVDESMVRFICKKLSCRIATDQWICALPIEELIARSACAYVASIMGLDRSFVEYRQGLFRCKELKLTMMTAELITRIDDKEYCIATLPAFIHQNRARQTDRDYSRMKKDRIAVCREYLISRANGNKEPYVVIVCEDAADLERMMQMMVEEADAAVDGKNSLIDFYERVYFTGEGIIRGKRRGIADSMMRLVQHDDGEFSLSAVKPVFLMGESIGG